jgi:hypothetical protein
MLVVETSALTNTEFEMFMQLCEDISRKYPIYDYTAFMKFILILCICGKGGAKWEAIADKIRKANNDAIFSCGIYLYN